MPYTNSEHGFFKNIYKGMQIAYTAVKISIRHPSLLFYSILPTFIMGLFLIAILFIGFFDYSFQHTIEKIWDTGSISSSINSSFIVFLLQVIASAIKSALLLTVIIGAFSIWLHSFLVLLCTSSLTEHTKHIIEHQKTGISTSIRQTIQFFWRPIIKWTVVECIAVGILYITPLFLSPLFSLIWTFCTLFAVQAIVLGHAHTIKQICTQSIQVLARSWSEIMGAIIWLLLIGITCISIGLITGIVIFNLTESIDTALGILIICGSIAALPILWFLFVLQTSIIVIKTMLYNQRESI